jgi:hypothetical protein
LLRFCLKLQLDSWKSLADELKTKDPFPEPILMDIVLLEIFRRGLDEIANEHNELHDWVDFSGREARGKRHHDGSRKFLAN